MGDIEINYIPRITFGIIVLNGEPFLLYNLRSLYAYAHQIIVVEGACPSAANVATVDGHSKDETLKRLKEFKELEDPQNKLLIVTAEDENKVNGFWTEKSEMSQAYAKRATGNYLWQIDSDEFYLDRDMAKVIKLLTLKPEITEITFRTKTFWGGLNYLVDGILLRLGDQDFKRVFAWGEGYKYITHRPPTVINAIGENLAKIQPISARQMTKIGVYLYHYEYLFPQQVKNKAEYYSKAPHCKGLRPEAVWAEECYMRLGRPFRVHNIYKWISWLDRYKGEHPYQIVCMIRDINDGVENIKLRHTDDIENLLNSYGYRLGRFFFKSVFPIIQSTHVVKLNIRKLLIDTFLWKYIQKFRGR